MPDFCKHRELVLAHHRGVGRAQRIDARAAGELPERVARRRIRLEARCKGDERRAPTAERRRCGHCRLFGLSVWPRPAVR